MAFRRRRRRFGRRRGKSLRRRVRPMRIGYRF